MTDEPENLVLVYLRRMDANIDKIVEEIRELKRRDTLHDVGFSSVRRGIAIVGEAVAHLTVRIDQIEDRLDRIERRLDIVSA